MFTPTPGIPQVQLSFPAAVHHGKVQDPLSYLPTSYFMMKPQVLLGVGQEPRRSALMDRPKIFLGSLSSQELEGTLIIWNATPSSLNSFQQTSASRSQYVNVTKAELP